MAQAPGDKGAATKKRGPTATSFKAGADNPNSRENRAKRAAMRATAAAVAAPGAAANPVDAMVTAPGAIKPTVRDEVLAAFFTLGGREYLVKIGQDRKQRHMFLALLGKCVPQAQELSGPKGGPIETHVLEVATRGLANLSDDELTQFRQFLDKMGASDPLLGLVPAGAPANDAVPAAAPAPEVKTA